MPGAAASLGPGRSGQPPMASWEEGCGSNNVKVMFVSMPVSEHTTRVLRPFVTAAAQLLECPHVVLNLHLHQLDVYGISASSELARVAEESQQVLGQGPSLSGAASTKPIEVTDLAAETRWPEASARLRQFGFSSVLVLPLNVGRRPQATLTRYHTAPAPESSTTRRYASLQADLEQRAVALLQPPSESDPIGAFNRDVVSEIMGETAVIHQAAGMLSVQLNSSVDVAMARLREYATTRNMSLATVAQRVVRREVRLPEQ